MIVAGECDALQQAFYMVGVIEEAFEKANPAVTEQPWPPPPSMSTPSAPAIFSGEANSSSCPARWANPASPAPHPLITRLSGTVHPKSGGEEELWRYDPRGPAQIVTVRRHRHSWPRPRRGKANEAIKRPKKRAVAPPTSRYRRRGASWCSPRNWRPSGASKR